ncbi:ABC transporter ATP-binding protein [Ruegeria pomeroyi]|uniref:ABC transporter ATP-binding protein n=1 Tax=Ruegeria pomeroyi TaxID=89184 RepID=A0A9Q3WML6_9RHOB|nr:ABC transporter ATP-binding protein [Ruegeria pomeroyi]MCE8538222.1 ABC transporter ATP-binding protein [Ruegeria pomeroyi]
MALLEIENLSAFYGRAQSLHDVSFSVEKGDIVAVIGTNGAGKSTLMDSIMGMVSNTGAIRLDGQNLVGRRSSEIVEMGVGYAPERAHLFPFMTVEDNLLVGGYTARDDIARNLAHVHELFPVLKARAKQETATQSGGERQMVSVGRALMTSPRLLLVDEPTIGLSPKVCSEIAQTLRRLNEEDGLTILITEQNINFAMSLARRVHVLETGHLRISGTPEELMEDDDLNRAYFGT